MPPDTPSPFRTMSHPFTSISSSDSHRHLTCSLLSLANASSTGSVEPQFFWRWNSCIWLWFQYVKLDLSFKAYALLRASQVSFRHIKGSLHWIKVISPTQSLLQPPAWSIFPPIQICGQLQQNSHISYHNCLYFSFV